MKNLYKSTLTLLFSGLCLVNCDSPAPLIAVQEANVDTNPLKVASLSDEQEKSWKSKDLLKDTIPGMSVDRTYAELLNGKQAQDVIVAVIDSGTDINHEDLKNVIWTNPNEIPNNGKDDDNNGYVDDIHGWNFLGDIEEEQLEFARIIDRYDAQFKGKTIASIPNDQKKAFENYLKAKAEHEESYNDALKQKQQIEQNYQFVKTSHEAIAKALSNENYKRADLAKIKNPDQQMQQYIGVMTQVFSFADTPSELLESMKGGIDFYTTQLNANLKLNASFRQTLGDNPYDISDVGHGNNNVVGPKPEGARHGTHVAGIIAAQRNNGIGVDGVAENVQIMVLRAVPDGDEYDKDIALAIRYAVDNGAKVINTSFGKSYSQNPEWVYDAIKYAAKNDVLIVNAAGNDGLDLDDSKNVSYPNDQLDNISEFSDTFLTVGALNIKYGSEMIASFSNYGKSNVDVFAPGVRIYSTTPDNNYEFLQGTSMASPATAGVAAMLRSYYPKMKANRVKEILMASGLTTGTSVVVPNDAGNKPFNGLSKSGKMVNMYNAFKLAEINN